MSSSTTWKQKLKLSTIRFNGGKSTNHRIHDYITWPLTTSPSLVSGSIIIRLNPNLRLPLLATSVDVERAFSHGRFLLPYTRNQLSSDSFRAQMCVGAWSLLGLVKDKDIVKGGGQDSDSESDFDIDSDDEDLDLESDSGQ